jgi:hypothetical protein
VPGTAWPPAGIPPDAGPPLQGFVRSVRPWRLDGPRWALVDLSNGTGERQSLNAP